MRTAPRAGRAPVERPPPARQPDPPNPAGREIDRPTSGPAAGSRRKHSRSGPFRRKGIQDGPGGLRPRKGLDGRGSFSYIGGVILRQRDANSGWTCSAPRREGAADGTLEERRYYCQNWRADLGAMVTSGGVMVEWAKFTSYGIPIGLPGGDTDSNGSCDGSDESAIHVWAAGYDARADFDLDGDIDGDDETLANSNTASTGWNALSTAANANRVGYAGYQHDYNLDLKHVRNRVYSTELGRWTRRDPLGYVDGMGLYEYVGAIPITDRDSSGLAVALQPNTLADPCQPNWSHITTYIECRDFCNMRRLRGDRSCNKQYDADKANCDIQFPDDEAARRLCKKNALIKRERCKREAIECQNRCLLKCMSHFIPNIADIAGGGGNIGYE